MISKIKVYSRHQMDDLARRGSASPFPFAGCRWALISIHSDRETKTGKATVSQANPFTYSGYSAYQVSGKYLTPETKAFLATLGMERSMSLCFDVFGNYGHVGADANPSYTSCGYYAGGGNGYIRPSVTEPSIRKSSECKLLPVRTTASARSYQVPYSAPRDTSRAQPYQMLDVPASPSRIPESHAARVQAFDPPPYIGAPLRPLLDIAKDCIVGNSTCVACGGTGVASSHRLCLACGGTGYTSRAKAAQPPAKSLVGRVFGKWWQPGSQRLSKRERKAQRRLNKAYTYSYAPSAPPFDNAMAKSVVKFIDELIALPYDVVLIAHCDAGVSRSGAVGDFACDRAGMNRVKFIADNPYIHPNRTVAVALRKAAGMPLDYPFEKEYSQRMKAQAAAFGKGGKWAGGTYYYEAGGYTGEHHNAANHRRTPSVAGVVHAGDINPSTQGEDGYWYSDGY